MSVLILFQQHLPIPLYDSHLCAERLELRDPVIECEDLGGADEGEVERVEEEDDVFALIVRETDLLELT